MKRRTFLTATAATITVPAIARGAADNVRKFVPAADLVILDPHWTTSYQTRDHAYMVFDQLFGLDSQCRPQPQMLEGFVTDGDDKFWKLTLRDGLRFHDGERVVFLAGVSVPTIKAVSEITGDLFGKLGINLDFQSMEWGTLLQRRVKTEPVEQGGWSVMHTFWGGLDHFDPAGHVLLRGNGKQAIFGWPDAPQTEALRNEWLRAPDLAAQKELASRIQAQALQDVPYIPLGQRLNPTVYRKSLSGVMDGAPVFWNVKRSG